MIAARLDHRLKFETIGSACLDALNLCFADNAELHVCVSIQFLSPWDLLPEDYLILNPVCWF